jgi:hypothetical protein
VDAVTHIWLAQDPETGRILVQQHDWRDGDFPRGLRGQGWPRREHDVDSTDLEAMLTGALDNERVDELHRGWWESATRQ